MDDLWRMQELDFNELTRRPDEHRPDCWCIFCGDICAGWIAKAIGMPNAQNVWTYSAGFYPGSRPGEIRTSTADSFDEAKAKFVVAWLKFAHSRTPADFAAWREQQKWARRKYAALDAGQDVQVR